MRLLVLLNYWYALPMGWRYVVMAVPIIVGGIASLAQWDWIPARVAWTARGALRCAGHHSSVLGG